MVDIEEKLKLGVDLDTQEMERGAGKVESILDGVKRKTKESNTLFERTGSLLGDLGDAAKKFGLGLVGAFTGVIASSPQFKAFMASLKGPWMRLTNYLGKAFKPALDKVSDAFKGFVNWFATNKGVKEALEYVEGFVSKTIELAVDYGGTAGEYLFGDADTKGIVPWLMEKGGKINKTLGISAEASSLLMLAGLTTAMGHPHIGLALAALAGYEQIKSQTMKMAGEFSTVRGGTEAIGRDIGGENVSASGARILGTAEAMKGQSWANKAVLAISALPEVIEGWNKPSVYVTVEDRTRSGVSANTSMNGQVIP